MFARMSQVSYGLKLFRFGRELIQFFGMHQRMALVAHESSGREFVGTAFAIANEFGSDGGHGFEERRLNSTRSSTFSTPSSTFSMRSSTYPMRRSARQLRGVVERSVDFQRATSGEFGGDFHADEEDHQANQPAKRDPASPNFQERRRQSDERHAREPTSEAHPRLHWFGRLMRRVLSRFGL